MAMSKAERERRHQAQLARIQRVQRIVGTGDRARIDHEGTLLEQARLMIEELRSHNATEKGLAAFERLLRRAEELGPRRAADLLAFLDSLCSHRPLPLRALRGQPLDVGDDMLAVLDAYRHARLTLAEQVDGGAARVARVLDRRTLASAA
jgi:hypothetical protein